MNILGIVAEYNPMHNGHIYHIKEAKKLTKADYVIVIMSGSFTEQGNIATINKMDRAKLAIQNGADIVIELPTIYAVSSAEDFAKGAINILNGLGVVTHIAFGTETKDIKTIETIADACLKNNDEILAKTRNYMKQGITYVKAKDLALKDHLDYNSYTELSKPNNILAVEYLKALKELNSQITPIPVHRCSSSHNSSKISDTSIFVSSTAIREVFTDNKMSSTKKLNMISNLVPENIYHYIKTNEMLVNENIWKILKYEIIKLTPSGLKNILDVCEGLENKIYSSAIISNNYNDFIFNVKSKRYTLSRIKRIAIYILLGITKDLKEKLGKVSYARILKINKQSVDLLSMLSKISIIPVITKLSETSNLDKSIKKSVDLDILSHNIAFSNFSNLDYTNNIIDI